MSQATNKIMGDRAHRFRPTGEAKHTQNHSKEPEKATNQGRQSHRGLSLYPCQAEFCYPPGLRWPCPFPTHTYTCVAGVTIKICVLNKAGHA